MDPHLRLRGRITIAVVVGALLVAGGVALLLANTVDLRNSADATLRSDAYLFDVINLERLVIDAETGLRGYVITARPLFLGPMHHAQQELPTATTALQQGAARDGAFQPQAQALITSARAYMSAYVPGLESLVQGSPRHARSFSETLRGKRLVDEIRTRAAALQRLVEARETSRQHSAHDSAEHSIVEAIAVLVALTVVTLLSGAALGRLAIGRERSRERSERTSRTLQRSLLPGAMPKIPSCELGIRFTPAGQGELVGGDFYDVFKVAPGRWAMVLGDVCGKGAEAAAVTAMARWTLRSLADRPTAPADALRFLNRAMLQQDLGGRFVTIVYVLVTVEHDHAQASVACGGHPPPILVPAAGEPRVVSARGQLLGVWPEIQLHTSDLRLRPGDALVAYTDGVTDQGAGPARVPSDALRGHPPGASAEQLAGALLSDAREPDGRQRDDIAILALRFLGSADGRR